MGLISKAIMGCCVLMYPCQACGLNGHWCYSVVVITWDFELKFPKTQVRTLVAPLHGHMFLSYLNYQRLGFCDC